MRRSPIKKLLALMENENAIIRRGDLKGLPPIAEQKEQLVKELAGFRASQVEIQGLQAAAVRNARLLAAAVTGIRQARERLDEIQAVQSSLNVYDAKGSRQTVTSKAGRLERKA